MPAVYSLMVKSTEVKTNATFFVKVFSHLKFGAAKLLNRVKAPSFIRDFEHEDKLTNQKISIKTQSLYTIISIDGRDYYFNRLNGKFDGTGFSVTCD